MVRARLWAGALVGLRQADRASSKVGAVPLATQVQAEIEVLADGRDDVLCGGADRRHKSHGPLLDVVRRLEAVAVGVHDLGRDEDAWLQLADDAEQQVVGEAEEEGAARDDAPVDLCQWSVSRLGSRLRLRLGSVAGLELRLTVIERRVARDGGRSWYSRKSSID